MTKYDFTSILTSLFTYHIELSINVTCQRFSRFFPDGTHTYAHTSNPTITFIQSMKVTSLSAKQSRDCGSILGRQNLLLTNYPTKSTEVLSLTYFIGNVSNYNITQNSISVINTQLMYILLVTGERNFQPRLLPTGTKSFSRLKRPGGGGVNHPPPPGGNVMKRTQLYLYSPSVTLRQVVGRPLPLLCFGRLIPGVLQNNTYFLVTQLMIQSLRLLV
jgi:hypothetical protein